MKIAITEEQINRLKLNLKNKGINEGFLDDLIAKGSEYAKKGIEFISGLATDVEKKLEDEPDKADFVGDNVDDFYEILENIDKPIKEEKYGSMRHQQSVEAVQIALQILGYSLPRFGTDGLFGPETAAAVNKYKKDNNISDSNDTSVETSGDINQASMIPPIPIKSGNNYRWNEVRSTGIHKGIDIGAAVGTPIKAIADGKVIAAGALDPDCGDGISIQHADGFVSSYCHLSNIGVSSGQSVQQGDNIGATGGAVGSPGSGNSKGPHLHLTLKKDGNRVNPLEYFGSSIGAYYDSSSSTTSLGGATISMEMVKKIINDLKSIEITSEDLKQYIDPARSTGGSPEFTDLDLNESSNIQAYKKICDNYIQQRDPGAKVTGDMMARSAEKVFKRYGKYVPPELALAQLTLEGGIDSPEDSRPNKTNNPFNVGNVDNGKNQYFSTVDDGVYAYYDLLARKYLVKGKTANDLVNDFRNVSGNRYASSTSYENGLISLIKSIRKKNAPVYASLLSEELLNEADKRQAIKNALGFNEEWADEFHRMSDKLSIWIASTFLNKMVDRYRNGVPAGEDAKEYVITTLNNGGPRLSGDWRDNYKEKYEYILHWIRAPRREQLNIRELSFDQAYELAEEWHETLQVRKESNFVETGDVFIDYRDSDGVGYYWVNLHVAHCSAEQERMGHCGRASQGGELISLRRINQFGEGESYLTVDYRPGGVLGDFHRHGNKKPTSRFHRQIVDFLINTRFPVTSLTRQGVHRYEDNFHLSDLSPADLKRVYDNNPSLKYDINNEAVWPEIIDGIINGDINFESYPASIKVKLLKKSKSLNKEEELLSKFTDGIITDIFNRIDELDGTDKTTFTSAFSDKLNDLLKSDFDRVYDSSSSDDAKITFIESLRRISQNLFNVYQSFCDYIDYGFKKFSEETRVEIVSSRGIKRTLFSCSDTIPFLQRFVDNTPVDVNGNISVKTEEGLWGLVKQGGETILHPQFLAVAPNPIDRFKTYIVKNQNGDFYKLNIADMSYTKLEKKR